MRRLHLGVTNRLAGHVPERFELIVEFGHGDGKSCHFLAGQFMSHDGVMDHDAFSPQDRLRLLVDDEEFGHRGGTGGGTGHSETGATLP